MFAILFVSMLFAIPGALILILDEELEPIKLLERNAKAAARNSRDRTGIRARLEEVGKRTQHDWLLD